MNTLFAEQVRYDFKEDTERDCCCAEYFLSPPVAACLFAEHSGLGIFADVAVLQRAAVSSRHLGGHNRDTAKMTSC